MEQTKQKLWFSYSSSVETACYFYDIKGEQHLKAGDTHKETKSLLFHVDVKLENKLASSGAF